MKYIFLCLISSYSAFSQKQTADTTKSKLLEDVTVQGYRANESAIKQLPDVHQNYIIAGKKNEIIAIQNLDANISEKTGRQVFAKIAGAFVYDMDGSGNQLNISTRGLDPHRSWEYNIRQNGVMTNSDIYGYPASHYSAPLESIQKIELIRGTASLQYGSQFGGMINYVTKQADSTKKINFESINSVGSYGLFSSYNAIGGSSGKFRYYAYYQKRVSDGYRKNASSDAEAQFLSLAYQFNSKLNLKAELGRSTYVFHLPGPQTDAQFYADPRQATRSRNYFSPDIYIPSIILDWKINESTNLNWTTSAVLGNRSSVQLVALANVVEDLTKNRQVDIDNFNSYSSELRLKKNYNLGSLPSVLITGLRYVNNDLHRQQLGKGTIAADYDLSITGNFGRDLHYKTQNVAFFIENLIYLTPKLSVSPAFRIESGTTLMSGTISYLAPEKVPNEIKHAFPLFGVNTQYKITPTIRAYAGWAQAYRPVIFSDVIPPTALDVTDPNLKDAFGYNAEVGVSGTIEDRLSFDVSYFQIQYNNRIGSLIVPDQNGQNYVYKTNVGNTLTNGLEIYAEAKALKTHRSRLSVFTATSYFEGFYQKGTVVINGENKSIEGNRLETLPRWISRSGIRFQHKTLSATFQCSHVTESFSDALNTVTPSADGAKGIVPAYTVLDLNFTMKFASNYSLKLGINNLTNEQYFTKRPTGYPGVGIWASDGRSIVATFSFKL
ncbi:MAG: TonB-dependent receptor [Bacteroidota bacterium]